MTQSRKIEVEDKDIAHTSVSVSIIYIGRRSITTLKPLQASTTTGAIMESTAEARLTFRHKLKNVPQKMFQGHVIPSLARHTIVGLGVL